MTKNKEYFENLLKAYEKLGFEPTEELKKYADEKKKRLLNEINSMDLPLDWINIFDNDARSQGIHADSASDGLILSLSNLGKVDIKYIASIIGKTYKEVILSLKGAIYQNPLTWNECFYKGWETAEEYLSGNLLKKKKSRRRSE